MNSISPRFRCSAGQRISTSGQLGLIQIRDEKVSSEDLAAPSFGTREFARRQLMIRRHVSRHAHLALVGWPRRSLPAAEIRER